MVVVPVTTFLGSFALFGGILLLASTPALVLARRRGLGATERRFWIAIGVVSGFRGVLAVSSEELIDQCRGSGSADHACRDFGGDGLVLMILIVFVGAALAKAVAIYRY